MRNKSLLLMLTVFFALCFACSRLTDENEKKEIVVFDEEDLPAPIALKGKKYNFPKIVDPRRILCVGDYLIVSEKTNGDLLHILDIESEKYVRSTGKNGFGPGEATLVSKLEKGSEHGSFWAYDPEQKIFSKYYINDSTSKLAKNQLRLGEVIYFVADLNWASDTTFMAWMVDGNDKYFEVSLQGDTLNTFGTWNSMMDRKDIPYNVISSIHQGSIMVSPDKSKFILAGIARDYIDVLDKTSGKILSIRGPVDEIPAFEVDYSQGYPMAAVLSDRVSYFGSFAGKNLLYALYIGKDYKYISDSYKPNRIFVFDYQGNIVWHYTLDYSLTSFTLDEEDGIIYGLTIDQEPNVVAFELPIQEMLLNK